MRIIHLTIADGGGGGGQGGMGPYGSGGGGSFGGGGGAGNGNIWADLIVARGSAGGGGGIGGGENGSSYFEIGAAGGSTTRGLPGFGQEGIISFGGTHGAGGSFGQGGGAGGPSAGFGGDIGLPGQSVSVQFEGTLIDEIQQDGLARRNPSISESASVHLGQSDFSLVSLAVASPLMRAFFKVADNSSKLVKEEIIKYTTVLSHVTNGRGPFRTGM